VYDPVGETTQTVHLEVLYNGPDPTSYTWDWGDGTPEETVTESVGTHTYLRLPGDWRTYTARVVLNGPGICADSGEAKVTVQGLCPEVNCVDVKVMPPQADVQEVKVELELKYAQGESYEWSWGDGRKSTTSAPNAVHEYDRKPKDTCYQIEVTLKGPGQCETTICLDEIIILGTCPYFKSIKTNFADSTAEKQRVWFTAVMRDPAAMPEQFLWDWGDGSSIDVTHGVNADHWFDRPASGSAVYNVQVTGRGPDCEGPNPCIESFAIELEIPGTCPVIIGIEPVMAESDDDEQVVDVMALIRGNPPQTYEWDWGDGSPPETTRGPKARHGYIRPIDNTVERIIRLKISGVKFQSTGGCEDIAAETIEIHPYVGNILSQNPEEL
jgi:hypothetical protein